MRVTCPSHIILLDFITRTIVVDQYRSWSSLLLSFLHSPVTLSLLGPNILLNTPKEVQNYLPDVQYNIIYWND
jgi:hypothetical protein